MTDPFMVHRLDAFTDAEREAIVEALDYFIAHEDHTVAAVDLYDEIIELARARGELDGDDDGG